MWHLWNANAYKRFFFRPYNRSKCASEGYWTPHYTAGAAGPPGLRCFAVRHNGAAASGYGIEDEADKARAIMDEMSTIADPIMMKCCSGVGRIQWYGFDLSQSNG